jgi:YHS domain-containing protein
MKIVITPLMCLAGLAMVCQSGSFGQASDPPGDGKKIKYFCPVAGMPEAKTCCCPGGYCPRMPAPEYTIEYKGAKVQLCCSQCNKIFKENPAKFAAVANHQLVATRQARQQNCPLCGGKIDPNAAGEVGGVKVSFCSEDCKKKVADASAKDRVNMVFGNPAFARGFIIMGKKE